MKRVTNLLTIATVFLMVFVSDHVKGATTIKEEQLDVAAQPPAAGSDPGRSPGAGGPFPFPGFGGISRFNFDAGGFGGLPPIPGFGTGARLAGWLCTILSFLPGCPPAQPPDVVPPPSSGVPQPPSPEAGGATPVTRPGGGSGAFATAPAPSPA